MRRVLIFSYPLTFFRFFRRASATITESTSDDRARSRAISEPTFPEPTTRTFKLRSGRERCGRFLNQFEWYIESTVLQHYRFPAFSCSPTKKCRKLSLPCT